MKSFFVLIWLFLVFFADYPPTDGLESFDSRKLNSLSSSNQPLSNNFTYHFDSKNESTDENETLDYVSKNSSEINFDNNSDDMKSSDLPSFQPLEVQMKEIVRYKPLTDSSQTTNKDEEEILEDKSLQGRGGGGGEEVEVEEVPLDWDVQPSASQSLWLLRGRDKNHWHHHDHVGGFV